MDVAPKEKTYTVGEAKERLRRVSARFDPFAVVRRKPLYAAGAAFLAGLAWGALRRGGTPAPVSLLPLAVQIVSLGMRWGLRPKDAAH